MLDIEMKVALLNAFNTWANRRYKARTMSAFIDFLLETRLLSRDALLAFYLATRQNEEVKQ